MAHSLSFMNSVLFDLPQDRERHPKPLVTHIQGVTSVLPIRYPWIVSRVNFRSFCSIQNGTLRRSR
jgi:hypothetical protein